MGDRIGLEFVDGIGNSSVVIHSHWMGRELLVAAQKFVKDMSDELSKMSYDEAPARFLMWYGETFGIANTIDLQDSEQYDDCEDNGVFTVDLETGLIA